jgi:hypothetical protein
LKSDTVRALYSACWPWLMADVAIIQDNSNVAENNKEEKGDRLEVFLAKDKTTNLLCAIKTERSDSKHPQLRIEQQIFLRMENCKFLF